MPDYKTQERLKYAIVLTSLLATLLLASALAIHNKQRAIRVREMAHKAIHVTSLTIAVHPPKPDLV